MALNLVVRSENDNPVVNNEIFLFIRFEMRAGLSPGKNMLKHKINEHMRRIPCSIVDGFEVLSSFAILSPFGCIAVLFITCILLKR